MTHTRIYNDKYRNKFYTPHEYRDEKGFNVPWTSYPDSLFGHEFHQIAIYTTRIDDSVGELFNMGFKDWSFDTATLEGYHFGVDTKIKATMAFNYQFLGGRELEYVSYVGHPEPRFWQKEEWGGLTRPAALGEDTFISHMSSYVTDLEESIKDVERKYKMVPFHMFVTSNHSNPAVAGRKFFKEAIYDTRKIIGFNVKLIEKVLVNK